jgi:hypothetical protein
MRYTICIHGLSTCTFPVQVIIYIKYHLYSCIQLVERVGGGVNGLSGGGRLGLLPRLDKSFTGGTPQLGDKPSTPPPPPFTPPLTAQGVAADVVQELPAGHSRQFDADVAFVNAVYLPAGHCLRAMPADDPSQ